MSEPIDSSHVWCDQCESIQPMLLAPMEGRDTTGQFSKPVDILCGTCHLVIATMYSKP